MAASPNEQSKKPVRIMIFPDRPDCILFYVPEGEQLVIPPLTAPFYKAPIASVLGMAAVNFRLTESVPGRWTESMQIMRKAERAERAQLQKQREAAMVKIERSGTELARTRADAIARKHFVDQQIRETKAWLGQAKSRAFTSNQYERPELFRAKQRDLVDLQTESLAIQQQLGELRKKEKAENVAASNEELRLFKKAANRVLSEEQFERILDAMADELEDEEPTDSNGEESNG